MKKYREFMVKESSTMFYTYGYLFYIPVNIVYFTVILVYGSKKRKSYPYYVFSLITAIYINKAVELVYFPMLLAGEEVWASIESIRSFMDFSLNFAHMGGLRQIGGNILLTVPMGLLLPFLFDFSKRILWSCVIMLSCMIEMIQLGMIAVFHCVSKAFDVKDIILNLAGGLLGLILFEALAAAVRKVIRPEVKCGFLKYIYEQCWHFSSGKPGEKARGSA